MSKARDLANAGTALGAVTATELGYVDGVTSAIQTQLDAKAPSSTAVTLTGTQTLTNKTLTNPVIASVVNNTLTSTTGDMIYASAANTPARLGIGSSAQVLTVAGGIPSWATPAGGGGMTLLSTTTLSGATTTISSISGSYKTLYAVIHSVENSTNNGFFSVEPNASSTITGLDNIYAQTVTNNTNGPLYLSRNASGFYPSRTNANNAWALTIENYASATNSKSFNVTGGYASDNLGGNVGGFTSFGAINTTSAISSLVFRNAGGNFSAGTVLLYGVS